MIPRRLIRTVPAGTPAEVESFWAKACDLHPGWEHVTLRDPIDPAGFPVTAPHWDRCTSGAQFAGLIRLEALWHGGGIYIDADIDPFRPLDPLLGCQMFACWEDENTVPDAVLGAIPRHPAVGACLELAIERLCSDSDDWRTGNGAWATGPGVTTTVLPGRRDVLLLPPGSFFPVHYSQKAIVDWDGVETDHPWAFAAHRWHASWVPPGG